MKLLEILAEVQYNTYEGMIQVMYEEGSDKTQIVDLIRALPGITTVTVADSTMENVETLKIKLITQKSALEAFESLKNTAMTKYPNVKNVKIGEKTIEKA
jgi:hypothetical protein